MLNLFILPQLDFKVLDQDQDQESPPDQGSWSNSVESGSQTVIQVPYREKGIFQN